MVSALRGAELSANQLRRGGASENPEILGGDPKNWVVELAKTRVSGFRWETLESQLLIEVLATGKAKCPPKRGSILVS